MRKFMPTGVDCFVLIIVNGLPEPFVSDKCMTETVHVFFMETENIIHIGNIIRQKKDFCDKLFTAFEKQITDNIFCFIQNDKELMKDYLDLVAKQGNLGVVNSQIAQKIAQRYGMNNTGKESVPNSNLIQTYSELEKK